MATRRNRYLIGVAGSFLMGILFFSGTFVRDNEAASVLVGLVWILVGVIWLGTYLSYAPHLTE